MIVDLYGVNGTDTASQRLRYEMDHNARRYGKELPLEAIDYTNDLNKIYMPLSYLDFANIKVEKLDEMVIGGVSNAQKDLECIFYCQSAVAPNCNIYCMLHYLELATFDSNGNVILLK